MIPANAPQPHKLIGQVQVNPEGVASGRFEINGKNYDITLSSELLGCKGASPEYIKGMFQRKVNELGETLAFSLGNLKDGETIEINQKKNMFSMLTGKEWEISLPGGKSHTLSGEKKAMENAEKEIQKAAKRLNNFADLNEHINKGRYNDARNLAGDSKHLKKLIDAHEAAGQNVRILECVNAPLRRIPDPIEALEEDVEGEGDDLLSVASEESEPEVEIGEGVPPDVNDDPVL